MAVIGFIPLAFLPHLHVLAFGESLSTANMVFLVVAIGLALSFEFVNGFHDTANAVATVIYTHSLPPWIAVIWSGLCNLAGVLTSSGLVAYTIVALLPVELVINVGSAAGFAMIFALLISAILWNLGTWYLGLPASSSHTLIGSILGVGLANAVMSGHRLSEGVNWGQVIAVFKSLLVSPIVGFVGAALLLLAFKALIRSPELFQPPPKDQPPPWPIRILLWITCTGVSFAHGSNDGQKGMGLLLLILIGILPAEFALNMKMHADDLRKLEASSAMIQPMLDQKARAASNDPAAVASASQEKPPTAGLVASEMSRSMQSPPDVSQRGGTAGESSDELSQYLQTGGKLSDKTYAALAWANHDISTLLQGKGSFSEVAATDRKQLRSDMVLVDQSLAKLVGSKQIADKGDLANIAVYHKLLDGAAKYLPLPIKVAVAIALGLGTMIGWKRIVTTVGEKIGKEHLNYGQGAAAELVAMVTIGLADRWGLPVSTTHVLSSGVAGTMAANRSGLQMSTLRNVALAWILTLPVCVILGAMTFSAGLYIVFRHLVPEVASIAIALALLLIARRAWLVVMGTPAPAAS